MVPGSGLYTFKGKANPVQAYYTPRVVQETEDPRFQENWYMKVVRLSTLHIPLRFHWE